MNARHAVVLGFRLFAIWMFVSAFQAYGAYHALKIMEEFTNSRSFLIVAVVGAMVLMAVLVWFFSGLLARMLTYGFRPRPVDRVSAFELVAVGCILMGLWWIKGALMPFIDLWRARPSKPAVQG